MVKSDRVCSAPLYAGVFRNASMVTIDLNGDTVGSVVVISIPGERTFNLKVPLLSRVVSNRPDLSVFDGREASATMDIPATPKAM